MSTLILLAQQKKAIIKVDTSFSAQVFEIPYAGVAVIDARFDKTKIGCIYNTVTAGFVSDKKHDADFPDSLNRYLPLFLKTIFRTDSSRQEKLMILIKKFRIADHFSKGLDNDDRIEIETTLNISASFFAVRNNNYYKLFSVENVLAHNIYKPHERKREFEEGTRAIALRILLNKLLQDKKWHTDYSGSYFTLPDIENGLNQRYQLPIYQTPYIKGIYKTFSEFKRNSPSITNINVIYKENKIISIKDEMNKPVLLQNIWGVSDGSKLYLHLRGELSELIPCDKSFKVLSYRTRAELRGGAGAGNIGSSIKSGLLNDIKIKEYFDLDMETGKVFLQEVFGKSTLGSIQFYSSD